MPLDHGDGNRLGALGIVHAMGLDPRTLTPDGVDAALPAGKHPILRWRLPDDVRDNPEAIAQYPRADLEGVAGQVGNADRYRLELRELPDWREPEWLARTIGNADLLRPRSVYLHYEPHVQPPIWQWPLRVGFLHDPASQHLHGMLEAVQQSDENNWRSKTVRLVPPTPTPTNCSLILVPSMSAAEAGLWGAAASLRCGSLLFLDWDQAPEPQEVSATARNLLESTWASGVLFAAIDEHSTPEFCFSMIRQLTHNFTVDAALVAACGELGVAYPVMMGSTALMRDSRLSRVMGRLTRSMESPRLESMPFEVSPGGDADFVFPMSGTIREVAEFGRRFEIDEDIFAHEGDYSVAMADLGETLEASMRADGVEPETRGPRFLQGKVTLCDADPAGAAPLTDYFRPGEPHRAEVRIGLPDPEWLQPKGNAPFPTDELPEDLAEYTLTVVFSVLSGDAIPKTGAAELPSQDAFCRPGASPGRSECRPRTRRRSRSRSRRSSPASSPASSRACASRARCFSTTTTTAEPG